jgi:hypothetical protein
MSPWTRTLTAALAAYHLAPLTRLTLGWVGVIADQALAPFGVWGRDSSFALRLDQTLPSVRRGRAR